MCQSEQQKSEQIKRNETFAGFKCFVTIFTRTLGKFLLRLSYGEDFSPWSDMSLRVHFYPQKTSLNSSWVLKSWSDLASPPWNIFPEFLRQISHILTWSWNIHFSILQKTSRTWWRKWDNLQRMKCLDRNLYRMVGLRKLPTHWTQFLHCWNLRKRQRSSPDKPHHLPSLNKKTQFGLTPPSLKPEAETLLGRHYSSYYYVSISCNSLYQFPKASFTSLLLLRNSSLR